MDAGYGIEALRLIAHVTEPMPPEQIGRTTVNTDDALADLFTSLGNRLGFDRVLRLLPADSDIPERSFIISSAAYSQAETPPPRRGPSRPAIIFAPELVKTPAPTPPGTPPARFHWRRMPLTTLRATGPERIAPEWWFDDPEWRSGLRDYWRVETREGPRLWLYHTPQSAAQAGFGGGQNWYAQGIFP